VVFIYQEIIFGIKGGVYMLSNNGVDVSVILPCYITDKGVTDITLPKWAEQTYPSYEVIIVGVGEAEKQTLYKYDWTQWREWFNDNELTDNMYGMHLWAYLSSSFLDTIDDNYVMNNNNLYTKCVRGILNGTSL
jgi:hypothetical protein